MKQHQLFRKTIALTGLACAFAIWAGPIYAAVDHHDDGPKFKTQEVKPGFTMLQGKGGNVLISQGQDGLLIIDDDYSEMSSALKETLEKFGGDLKYILNTHWHPDHTGGNIALGKGTDIIAHDNVYKRLSTKQEIKLFNVVKKPYPRSALPVITFDRSLTLHFNGDQIRALHFPNGHTDGDSIIYFKSAGIVHMGDHYFAGTFPFVDVNTGGSVRGMAKNITDMLDSIDGDTLVVPGHGPLSNKKALIEFRDMISGTADEVESMMKNSMSLEAMQDKGLSKKWDEWAKGSIDEKTWIMIIRNSLEKDA